jgi:hypothetical protein
MSRQPFAGFEVADEHFHCSVSHEQRVATIVYRIIRDTTSNSLKLSTLHWHVVEPILTGLDVYPAGPSALLHVCHSGYSIAKQRGGECLAIRTTLALFS